MMEEKRLHEVWKQQYFSQKGLKTVSGESVQVIHVGDPNEGVGPDFLYAKIIVDGMTFYGHVEVHVKSSAWYTHNHAFDSHYNGVILHVVWEANRPTIRADGTSLRTLALKDYVDYSSLTKYPMLQEKSYSACYHELPSMDGATLRKRIVQRMDQKVHFVKTLFEKNNYDTEETTYHILGYNFGFKVNSMIFLQLVESVPFSLLRRYRANLLYLEAVLLGQAGLLSDIRGMLYKGYVKDLVDGYRYLQEKHRLRQVCDKSLWRFAKLRPANFPTIRIAQFARLIHLYADLFSLLMNTPLEKLKRQLGVRQSSYWQTHYVLGKKSPVKIGALGRMSVENIVINSVVPLLVTYGRLRDDDFFIDKGLDILHDLPAEDNAVVRRCKEVGFVADSAWESQAVIELFKPFAPYKKCLSC